MTTTLQTSEILDLSADKIQERGWTWGSDGWNRSGQPENSRLCLEGGILAALGIRFPDDESFDEAYESFNKCPAYKAVQSYLNIDRPLYIWNDDLFWEGGRDISAGEARIVEVLRGAAAVERVKEAALVPAVA